MIEDKNSRLKLATGRSHLLQRPPSANLCGTAYFSSSSNRNTAENLANRQAIENKWRPRV
jgi:hypothetical protein